jgi:uncharacterized protein YegJ (DUF2314 family)
MKRNPLFFLLTLFFLASGLTGCSKPDKVITVADDDAEMLAAIATARGALPQFWDMFEKRPHKESAFSLKVKITDKKKTEFFWLTDIERKDGQTLGTIDNEPETVKSVKAGQRITIPDPNIADWFYMRDGKMVGNYTLRVLFKQMPPEEVAKYKKIMADP